MNFVFKKLLSVVISLLYVMGCLSCQKSEANSDGNSDVLGTWVLSDNIVDEYSTALPSIEILPTGVCAFSDGGRIDWFRRNNIIVLCGIPGSGIHPGDAYFFTLENDTLKYYDDHFHNGQSTRPDGERAPLYRRYTRTKKLSDTSDKTESDNSDLIGRWETQRITPGGMSGVIYQFLEFYENGQHSFGQYSSISGYSNYVKSDYLWARQGNIVITFLPEPNSTSSGYRWSVEACHRMKNDRIIYDNEERWYSYYIRKQLF